MASKKTIRRKAQKEGKEPILPRKPKGIKLTESHKEAIQTTMILKRLNSFVLDEDGDIEMSGQKITAALGLLKKVMPDLQSTHETKGEEKSHDEWIDEIEKRIAEGKAEKQP